MKNRTEKIFMIPFLFGFGFVPIELDELKLCDKPTLFYFAN